MEDESGWSAAAGGSEAFAAFIEASLPTFTQVADLPDLLRAAADIVLHTAAAMVENASLAPEMTDLALDLNEINNRLRTTLRLPGA